jgi:hypothetical protein
MNAPSTASGVPSRTLKGSDQLSYWAARIRNTITTASTNTAAPPAAFFSWYDIAFHAYPISAGSTSRATCSTAAIACPEL